MVVDKLYWRKMNSMGNTDKRIRILFVDDMSKCCKDFMKGLSGNYSVYWTKTKKEALKQIKENRYDLVITDYHLGNDDPKGGLDIITNSYNRSIPVISISKENNKNEALNSGANRFVFKKEFFNNIEKIIFDVLKNGK